MLRLNSCLMILLTVCALSVVTSQYKTRRYYAALQREKQRHHSLIVEQGQLQLEQSTLGVPMRIEMMAAQTLKMHPPTPDQTHVLFLPENANTRGAF